MSVSRDFYVRILGFEEAEWGSNDFTFVSRNGCGIHLCQGDQGQSGTWVWIGFDGDMDSLYDECKANGVVIREAPTNYPWALEMKLEDPDKHVLRFGTEPRDEPPS